MPPKPKLSGQDSFPNQAEDLFVTYNIKDPQLSQKLVPTRTKTALGVVEYVEIGDGPVVVALHGAMGGCDQSLILAQTIGNAVNIAILQRLGRLFLVP